MLSFTSVLLKSSLTGLANLFLFLKLLIMTTKTILTLAIFAIIPVFISSLLLTTISMDYWLGNPVDNALINTIKGNINNSFVAIMFGLSALGSCIVFTAFLLITPYIPKIDRLEEERFLWSKAKQDYINAKEKLITQLLKNN
jgi:hypothetical protein